MKKSETGQILDYVRHIDGRFEKINQRFDRVDASIEGARAQLVDLVTRVHNELAGRIVDLEHPPKGNRGGNGGVPLAS